MSLNWYGNPDWCDDKSPEELIPVHCPTCSKDDTWIKPRNYYGAPPKHDCGGTVEFKTAKEKA